MHHQREATERCIRTAYHIAYEDWGYTDYKTLLRLQLTNGLEMRRALQSRWSCTEMIDIVKDAMADKLINEILGNQRRVSVIVDQATSMAKSCCLIVYLRAVIKDSPENIFLDIIELSSQNADEIYNALLGVLNRNKITHHYFAMHFAGFTSDGASVIQGINRGVATKLKKRYPQMVLWHCLNHRLELAVSDTLQVVQRVNQVESFFSKVYSVYSHSPKLQRELKDIASDMEVQLRNVGRILTTRWVASSF